MARKAKIEKWKREKIKPKYKTRYRNRCRICGRPRGYIRDFELCRICFRIMEILKREGYIENFKELDIPGRFKMIKVYLKYEGKKSVINDIQRVSKPGRRIYVDKKNIPRVLQGYGIAIISTSSGVLTDKEARKLGVGGEYIGYVW